MVRRAGRMRSRRDSPDRLVGRGARPPDHNEVARGCKGSGHRTWPCLRVETRIGRLDGRALNLDSRRSRPREQEEPTFRVEQRTRDVPRRRRRSERAGRRGIEGAAGEKLRAPRVNRCVPEAQSLDAELEERSTLRPKLGEGELNAWKGDRERQSREPRARAQVDDGPSAQVLQYRHGSNGVHHVPGYDPVGVPAADHAERDRPLEQERREQPQLLDDGRRRPDLEESQTIDDLSTGRHAGIVPRETKSVTTFPEWLAV